MKKLQKALIIPCVSTVLLGACAPVEQKPAETVSGLNPELFADTVDGKATALFILKNENGMEVCITNYGGRVVSLCVPDKDGKPTAVVLG